jgi:hypothetical protein
MFEHTTRRPDGQETLLDPDGGIQQFDTKQCPHCGKHFRIKPGSPALARGEVCMKCGGQLTCGDPRCDLCIPFRAQIEHLEGRRSGYTDIIRDLLRR